MEAADWIVDFGPGAGEHGGRVVSAGTPAHVMADPASLTGAYLSGRARDPGAGAPPAGGQGAARSWPAPPRTT